MEYPRAEIRYSTYTEYKRELDSELQRSAESFVRIGYLLKIARDTDILKDSGYDNVVDFARKEYGIDKTQVSRFMNINDRFSENGYSDQLEDRYKGFGYAKLAIMLQLPDAINEELDGTYSKSDIQTIKDEIDAEKNVSDIEVMIEAAEQTENPRLDALSVLTRELCRENPVLFKELYAHDYEDTSKGWRWFTDILAPSGSAIYSIRIPGVGRKAISVKETEPTIKVIDIRNPQDMTEYAFEEVWKRLRLLFMRTTAEESYRKEFGVAMGAPMREEPLTQPIKTEPKEPEKRRTPKVTKAETNNRTSKNEENHGENTTSTQQMDNEAEKTPQNDAGNPKTDEAADENAQPENASRSENITSDGILKDPQAEPEEGSSPHADNDAWIPCAERMPDNGTYALVTILIPSDLRFVEMDYVHEGRWRDHSDKAIAWMPLPKPYEGK